MKSAEPGPIEFEREIKPARMLRRDSSGKLAAATSPVEFRRDPLTGDTCRIVSFDLERIRRPDLAALERRSREFACPFCPPLVTQITPRFPAYLVPEGDIRVGRALAFPNRDPYDIYGIVVVVSEEHFIPPDKLDLDTIDDALAAAQTYLKAVSQSDPTAKYHFIAWNYLPPAGASLVHPHLQANAGYRPTNYQRRLLEASEEYYRQKGTNYWADLIAAEKQNGERYVGRRGAAEWLTAFAPRGRLGDVLAVFPGRASFLELADDERRDFVAGLLDVIAGYDGLNLVSFNLATYSGFDAGQFWAHVRITPRALLLYSPIETSDQFYYPVLQDENVGVLPPEAAAARLKQYFTVA